ncbi:hypothetical protein Tco_1565788 [Tanacetum coccineum]
MLDQKLAFINLLHLLEISAIKGKRETAVKPSAGCNWRHKRHYWNKVSKYNGGSSSRNYVPKRLGHMTRNKAYLAEYQDFNGGPVAFGGSKGYIIGKGSSSCYLGFRESLERDIDGTEELLLPDLFILWLTKVSTDSAKLIPLGKDSTAIETLEKIPPRV